MYSYFNSFIIIYLWHIQSTLPFLKRCFSFRKQKYASVTSCHIVNLKIKFWLKIKNWNTKRDFCLFAWKTIFKISGWINNIDHKRNAYKIGIVWQGADFAVIFTLLKKEF